jgi:hypothetical protein
MQHHRFKQPQSIEERLSEEAMQDYRAFVIGRDGHILQRHEFLCADDEAAKKRVQQMVDGYDVELWHRDHKIATFRHNEAMRK